MNIVTSEHTQKGVRYATIAAYGRITAFRAPELRECFDGLLAQGFTYFVLDLQHVEFLDSAGMAALIHLLKHAQHKGGDVKLVLPQAEAARRILRLTRFDKVFSLAETVEEASQRF